MTIGIGSKVRLNSGGPELTVEEIIGGGTSARCTWPVAAGVAYQEFVIAGLTEIVQDKPDALMQFFAFAHLPPAMQKVSEPFCRLAEHVHANLPRNAERTVALRKLLEAKDAAVRAAIAK